MFKLQMKYVTLNKSAHIELTENFCKYHTLQEILHPNLKKNKETTNVSQSGTYRVILGNLNFSFRYYSG